MAQKFDYRLGTITTAEGHPVADAAFIEIVDAVDPKILLGEINVEIENADLHARKIVAALSEKSLSALVDKFLAWKLPQSVCSDTCVTDSKYKYPRSGTNLLSATEARQMIEYLFAAPQGA